MSLSNSDLVQILLALLLILISAHSVGFLFQRMRQPVVIGEIVGGLILGPTVAGYFLPAAIARDLNMCVHCAGGGGTCSHILFMPFDTHKAEFVKRRKRFAHGRCPDFKILALFKICGAKGLAYFLKKLPKLHSSVCRFHKEEKI